MKPLSMCMSNGGWTLRVRESVWRVLAGEPGNQGPFIQGYGTKPNPILKVGRVNGTLVPLGRNEIMRLLIQKHWEPEE